GPQVTTAPPADPGGLVRLPTWLWTGDTAATWPEQLHADAAAAGVRVDAYAEPSYMEWDMGDGQPPVRCDGPGAAWGPAGDVFRILAMTTWRVWWEINGDYDNEMEIQVGTTATYPVNEVQVLTRR